MVRLGLDLDNQVSQRLKQDCNLLVKFRGLRTRTCCLMLGVDWLCAYFTILAARAVPGRYWLQASISGRQDADSITLLVE